MTMSFSQNDIAPSSFEANQHLFAEIRSFFSGQARAALRVEDLLRKITEKGDTKAMKILLQYMEEVHQLRLEGVEKRTLGELLKTLRTLVNTNETARKKPLAPLQEAYKGVYEGKYKKVLQSPVPAGKTSRKAQLSFCATFPFKEQTYVMVDAKLAQICTKVYDAYAAKQQEMLQQFIKSMTGETLTSQEIEKYFVYKSNYLPLKTLYCILMFIRDNEPGMPVVQLEDRVILDKTRSELGSGV